MCALLLLGFTLVEIADVLFRNLRRPWLNANEFAAENATALLETLLGGDASLEPLKRLLLARTEGNPLFLEESVRSLVDDRVLAGERGAYRPRTRNPAARGSDSG